MNNKPEFNESNDKLKKYHYFWDQFDELIIIKPQNYNFSFKWRENAEQKMDKGMSKEEIQTFVQFFQTCLPPDIYFEDLLLNRKQIKNEIIIIKK